MEHRGPDHAEHDRQNYNPGTGYQSLPPAPAVISSAILPNQFHYSCRHLVLPTVLGRLCPTGRGLVGWNNHCVSHSAMPIFFGGPDSFRSVPSAPRGVSTLAVRPTSADTATSSVSTTTGATEADGAVAASSPPSWTASAWPAAHSSTGANIALATASASFVSAGEACKGGSGGSGGDGDPRGCCPC